MRVLVTGGSGGLGRYVVRALEAVGAEVIAPNRCDITDAESVGRLFDFAHPDAVVHLAAFASVPGCKEKPAAAVEVNVWGTSFVAAACDGAGARMVYMSTDAVFSGTGPHHRNDLEAPASTYAWSKFAGERAMSSLGSRGLIVRANFFTRHCNSKRSFAAYIVDSAKAGERFRCYSNVVATPVFAGTLAERIVRAVVNRENGTLHVASSDAVDRAQQAALICEAYGLSTEGIESCQSPDGDSDGRLVGDVVGTVEVEAHKMAAAEPL